MKTTSLLALVVATLGLLWASPGIGHAQTQPASIAPSLPPGVIDVVKLAQAKMSDAILLAKIKDDGIGGNLTTDQILYLSGQGVSQAVISALMTTKPGGDTAGSGGNSAATTSSPAVAEPPPLDATPAPATAESTPAAANGGGSSSTTGVFWKNQGQDVALPTTNARNEDGTPDEFAVMRTYYFKVNGTVPVISAPQVVLTHRGAATDLSDQYLIEGADAQFIFFKLTADADDPTAFKAVGRYDLNQKKMEFDFLNVPGIGKVSLFGIGKKKLKHWVQTVDDQTQICTVVSKLSSGFYAMFDGKDFYVFQYAAPPKK